MTSVTMALAAADRAVARIAARHQDDLVSLDEQFDEIKVMMTYEPTTDDDRRTLLQLKHKIMALNPNRLDL